jgi:hypothetical protein
MDADTIKRLKGWFYLRLSAEDWTQFGKDAPQVLGTFDDDPDQENALLRFAITVILVEAQKLTGLNHFRIMNQRLRELIGLGIDSHQLKNVWIRELTRVGIDRQELETVWLKI